MSGMKNDLHVKKLLPLDKPHKGNGLELAGNFLEYPLTNTGKVRDLKLLVANLQPTNVARPSQLFHLASAAETSSPSITRLTYSFISECLWIPLLGNLLDWDPTFESRLES